MQILQMFPFLFPSLFSASAAFTEDEISASFTAAEEKPKRARWGFYRDDYFFDMETGERHPVKTMTSSRHGG